MDTMTITKKQLEAALLRWEHAARGGETMSHEEADALPVEKVAREGANRLWDDLLKSPV